MFSSNYLYERLRYNVQEPLRAFFAASPRKLIFASNLLITIFSISLSAFSIFLCTLLYDPGFISGWVDWLGLSIVGACLAFVCIIGMRGAHLVSLEYLLTYFWSITIFVGPLLLGTIAAFDFYSYMNIWFAHQWDQPSFYRVRNIFCPINTVNTLCVAPVSIAPYSSMDAWCYARYGNYRCSSIRSAAMSHAIWWGRTLTLAQASVCIVDLALIVWSLYISFGMITSPVITQSMNDIINYLLLVPIGGCAGIAAYIWWLTYYNLTFSWIAELFLFVAVAQIVALPLGVVAGRMKSRVLMSLYIALIVLIVAGLGVAGSIGLIFANLIPRTFLPSTNEAADIACRKSLAGCCCCNQNLVNRCPEWSVKEVVELVVTDIKISGAVAFISMGYLLGALAVASVIHHNLKNYKTDYI